MREVFYTKEQKSTLQKISEDNSKKRLPASEATAALVLDALGEQQNTLQNIESILQRIEIILAERQIQ